MFWNSQNETSEVGDTGPVPPHLSISWVAPTTFLVETREEASLGPLSLHSGWNNLLPWLWNLSCPMCWKSPGLNLCSLSWIAVWFPQASCMPALLSLPLKTLFLEVPIFYIIHVTSHFHPWHPEINMKRMLSSLPSMPFHCMLLTYTSTDRSHGLRMLPYHSLGVLPLSFVLHPL